MAPYVYIPSGFVFYFIEELFVNTTISTPSPEENTLASVLREMSPKQMRAHYECTMSISGFSRDYRSMLAGYLYPSLKQEKGCIYSLKLAKSMADGSIIGYILVGVIFAGPEYRKVAALRVIESTFTPIPATNYHLTIDTLKYETLRDIGLPKEVREWQVELHTALRHHLPEEIKEMLVDDWVVSEQASAQNEIAREKQLQLASAVSAKKQKAIPLNQQTFELEVPNDMSVYYYTIEPGNIRAYFRLSKSGIALFAADKGHVLELLLKHYKEIDITHKRGDSQALKAVRDLINTYLKTYLKKLGCYTETA